jgi:hypothetical protein
MPYQPSQEETASKLGVLFKYRPVKDLEQLGQVLSMIRNRSLWFWHLTGQNDGQECAPKVFFGGGSKAIYRFFVEDLRCAYPKADLEKIKQQARQAARSPVIPNPRSIYRHWGVCCFSSRGNDPRLWDEYACGSNGVVISYKADAGSSLGLAGRVKYTDTPVCVDILKLSESIIYEVFTTKQKKWEHEAEYRIVERLNSPETGRDFHYRDIAISGVIIGIGVSENKREIIERTCAEFRIPVSTQQDNASAPSGAGDL